MLNQSSDADAGQRFKPVPVEDGFLFTACTTVTDDKVLVSSLSDRTIYITIRNLTINWTMWLEIYVLEIILSNYLRLVSNVFSRNIHGIREADINKNDHQNWASAQRTCFPSVRLCLHRIVTGDNERDICDRMALGLEIYLEVIWYCMEIFVSLTATLSKRVSYVALVATFLGIWENLIILHPEFNLKSNFITR